MEEKKLKLLEQIENHVESYEEIKTLIFTSDMQKKEYSKEEQEIFTERFLKLKKEALMATKLNYKMTYMAAFVLYRIVNKVSNNDEKINRTLNKLLNQTSDTIKKLKVNSPREIVFPWEDFKDYIDTIKVK